MSFTPTFTPVLMGSDLRFEYVRVRELIKEKSAQFDAFDVQTTVDVKEQLDLSMSGCFMGPEVEDDETRPPDNATFVVAKDEASYENHETYR